MDDLLLLIQRIAFLLFPIKSPMPPLALQTVNQTNFFRLHVVIN